MAKKLPSTPIGRERLLKGAALLEADAERKDGIKFDFRDIGHVEDADNPMSCGTVGCALGLFGVSKAFEQDGLQCHLTLGGYIYLDFKGQDRGTFPAAESLFEISPSESHFLFASAAGLPRELTGAKAERAVARRIRDFVAGKVVP